MWEVLHHPWANIVTSTVFIKNYPNLAYHAIKLVYQGRFTTASIQGLAKKRSEIDFKITHSMGLGQKEGARRARIDAIAMAYSKAKITANNGILYVYPATRPNLDA